MNPLFDYEMRNYRRQEFNHGNYTIFYSKQNKHTKRVV